MRRTQRVLYCGVAGIITRSALNGPISVVPVILSGRRLLSSLTHIRSRYLSLCWSSVVSESAIAGIFCVPNSIVSRFSELTKRVLALLFTRIDIAFRLGGARLKVRIE